jgi:hypothetical protein
MIWIILIAVGVLLYRFYQVVKITRIPKQICKRHTWKEGILINPQTHEISQLMFCEVCQMVPSEDLDNPQFLEILK